jgi:hypothetical protein
MTTEGYLEMCEMMGDEVDESMLMDLDDFPQPFVSALEIYNYLPDMYLSSMDGAVYLGKDLTAAPNIMEIYGVEGTENVQLALWALKAVNDRVRKKSFAKSKGKTTPPKA